MKLNAAVLADGIDGVATPSYDRSEVTAGIVHFGVGGFHRAHQAMYIDALLNRGTAKEWGICGVGVLPQDAAMRDALKAQDYLYTLVEKHSDGSMVARVIGSIVDYLFAPDDPEAVIARMASPETKIVSTTITEGGYAINDVTGEFNPEAPGVAEDLARDGGYPATVFGLVVEALRRRRDAGVVPFTLQSCDNLPHNGDLAKVAFVSFAKLVDPELGAWIEREVHFPNSMVDRITPVTVDGDRADLAERFGIEDRWPVVCEPFTQWVVEDSFSAGRAPLEDVGVQYVTDVTPYELMKLRLLNCSHQGIAYFGRLCDYTYAHVAAQDPVLREFLRRYMDEEATPTLPPVPGVDLDEYKATLLERFSNPGIADTVARLGAEASDRIPKWLVPVIFHNLEHDGQITLSAAIVASWARFAEGVDEHGEPIEIDDRRREQIIATAPKDGHDPLEFLADPTLFGDLATNARFVDAYEKALASLHEHGAHRTLQELVGAKVN